MREGSLCCSSEGDGLTRQVVGPYWRIQTVTNIILGFKLLLILTSNWHLASISLPFLVSHFIKFQKAG